jgi:hypothetical protein
MGCDNPSPPLYLPYSQQTLVDMIRLSIRNCCRFPVFVRDVGGLMRNPKRKNIRDSHSGKKRSALVNARLRFATVSFCETMNVRV